MIGTGPCCQPAAAFVAWRSGADAPIKQAACTGVRQLTTSAIDGDYTIWTETSIATYTVGAAAYYWVGVLAARTKANDPADVRVGFFVASALQSAGLPTFVLTAATFEDPYDFDLTPGTAAAGWTIFRADGAAWIRETIGGSILFGLDFGGLQIEPAGFWQTDGNGEPIAPGGLATAFPIPRTDLAFGSLLIAVETPDLAVTQSLAFLSRSHETYGAGRQATRYRFRSTDYYTSGTTTPDLASLGPYPVVVQLDVVYLACATRPALAQVSISGPAYGDGVGGVPSYAIYPSYCLATWLPSGEWLEFAFEGDGLPTASVVGGSLSYVHPQAWSVAPATYQFAESDQAIGTRGLNWPSQGIAELRRCIVTGVS